MEEEEEQNEEKNEEQEEVSNEKMDPEVAKENVKEKKEDDSIGDAFVKTLTAEERAALMVDADSVPACTSLGCKYDSAAKKLVPKDDHPVDYYVPNFGGDKDMVNTKKHWEDLEKIHGPWVYPKEKTKDPPKDYPVANFGQDRDITDSLKNMNDQEKIHGKWTLPKEDV